MIHDSLWREVQPPRFESDRLPDEVDVVVIGGGITGLTAAYLLKKAGKRVLVLERDRVGAGETASTSAHVTHVTDLALTEIASRFGRDAARTIWKHKARAIDLIESIATGPGVSCGFQRVPGFTCSPFLDGKDESRFLRDEATLASELGFPARYVESGPVTGKPAVAYADQAIFHPMEYIAGLALAIDGGGSSIVEDASVDEVIQDPLAVLVRGESIACSNVVIATHVPLTGSTGIVGSTLLQTKLYPYSTYVLGAWVDDSIAPGLYSDTADPYYYLRVHDQGGRRYAIFGGEDHKTGKETDTDACYTRLREQFVRIFPAAQIERQWSGQVIETVDRLPYVGLTADHQYVATGYAGNGLTFGTLAGMMIHDAITGIANPLRELLDPDRKAPVGDVGTYISENVDFPYHFIADRLRQNTSDGPESVARGDGKVLTIGGKRMACHRTNQGALHQVSAVCTHMGCLVRWNGAEQTWDCPCHGSRFAPDGKVIGGPAEAPLEPMEE